MDVEVILDLFWELCLIRMAIKVEKGDFSKIIKNQQETILFEGLGHAFGGQHPSTND